LKLLAGHDATVAEFVANLSPIERPEWGPYCAIGIIRDDGALVAGVVLSNWREQFRTIEFSAAAVSSTAFRPRIVAELGDFIFGKLDAYRVWARTSIRNDRAQSALAKVGFIREAVSAHWYGPTHHATLWRYLRPQWESRAGAKLQIAA
jgi:RimJ/RimL family protein N-acetyltransferase